MQRLDVKVEREQLQGLSLQALLIGLVFSVCAVLIVSYAELVVKEIQIAICQFNPLALGLLAILVALNGLVSWVLRRPFLRPHEILIVYTMTVLAAMIASRGLMEKLLPALVAINYFANPQNRWAEAFFPHIPKWLVPFDPKGMEAQPSAKYFYEGSKGVVVWGEWLTPLLAWSVVVAGVWMCFLAIATIWRRQWADHEKLNFPLTQPPLQLIEPSNRSNLLRSRLAWTGFAISAFVFFVNGLNRLYPAIPQIRVSWTLNDYLTDRPFNAIFFSPPSTLPMLPSVSLISCRRNSFSASGFSSGSPVCRTLSSHGWATNTCLSTCPFTRPDFTSAIKFWVRILCLFGFSGGLHCLTFAKSSAKLSGEARLTTATS